MTVFWLSNFVPFVYERNDILNYSLFFHKAGRNSNRGYRVNKVDQNGNPKKNRTMKHCKTLLCDVA